MVVVGARAEGLARADAVRSDDAAGMELVVDHLVERGHRRIAHLGGAGGAVAAERAAGYRAAMTRHGLAGEIVVQACDFSEDGGYAAAAALLDGGRPVTALAAVNDLAAVGAMSAAADAGLDLPAGLAVTGYDDTFLAEVRQISLTSVNPDSAGMGELAARRLLERIASPDRPGVEHLVAPRLVIRASSAQPIPLAAGGGPVTGRRPVVVALGAVDPTLVTDALGDSIEFVAQPGQDDLAIAEGAIVRADAVVDAALLARTPRLRVLARTGVGVDLVDLEEASACGIAVVITPGAGTRAVAEGVLAHALHLVKRLTPLTWLVREAAGRAGRRRRRRPGRGHHRDHRLRADRPAGRRAGRRVRHAGARS